jgi:hypothetical protein
MRTKGHNIQRPSNPQDPRLFRKGAGKEADKFEPHFDLQDLNWVEYDTRQARDLEPDERNTVRRAVATPAPPGSLAQRLRRRNRRVKSSSALSPANFTSSFSSGTSLSSTITKPSKSAKTSD